MSTPFGTSLRRDPTDPRGLKERIDALLRHLPDYWQRFEAVKAALVLEQTQAAAARPGLLGRD
ncbi:MAG: hypothetical protein HY217_02975 [Candidatus Rokubacteria bacterium]|nr:hypothetical protein [Candidatus Rokubacteria bacterium]